MPPLILSPSFNSTGSVSAPPNLTISGIMSAASGVFSGNVGIGTGSPNLQLTLTGSLLLFNNSSGIHQNIYYNSGWKYSTNGYGWAISDIGSGSLAFQMAPNNTAGAGATATVSQPVVITNSGNVGIGTTSPTNMLDIVGQYAAQFSGYQVFTTWRDTNDANKGFRIQTAGGNTLFSTDATGGGTYTERMRITSSGNVGIGTSSPSALLHVSGSASDIYTMLQNTETGGRQWIFTSTSNSSGEGGGKLIIKDGTAGAARVGIDSSGNVGIGTSSPSQKLDVNGTIKSASGLVWGTQGAIIDEYAAGNQIRMYTNTAGKGGWFQFPAGLSVNNPLSVYVSAGATSLSLTDSTNNSLYVKHSVGPVTFGTDAGGQIAFATNGFSERMRITSSGNVGVGTSSPAYKLHIAGETAQFPSSLFIAATAHATSRRACLTLDDWLLLQDSNGDGNKNFALYQGSTGATRMYITTSGNVGIGYNGSYTTYDRLVVGGNVVARNSSAVPTYLAVDAISGQQAVLEFQIGSTAKWGQWVDTTNARLTIVDANFNDGVYIAQNATSWTANSDSRLKDVQGVITNALDKVQQLTGVKFTWKREADNPDAKVRVGLIAQDVQAVLPEAVDDDSPYLITNEETGRVSGGLGVRYTELVPLLVNAIKELTARVVALESQISSGAA